MWRRRKFNRVSEGYKRKIGTRNCHSRVSQIVHLIKPSDVVGITDTTGTVDDHTFITALGLLRVGYDTMVGAVDEVDTVKTSFDRILRN